MVIPSRGVLLFVASVVALLRFRPVAGHGYLSTPRSRNLYAYEETSWVSQTADDPQPEDCPQCLSRGGSHSRCGMAGERNYDAPRNALGGLMKTTIQATYAQGQEIVMDVILTAHHQGHFVFSACPVMHGEVPRQDCFDKHQLTFVKDLLHDGNYDPSYPERAYVAPASYVGKVGGSSKHSFKMRLPSDVYGDLVLIQWYYLTANSCIHEGYMDYNWPIGWDYGFITRGAIYMGVCPPGGTEQFWNCAEVKINRGKDINIGLNNNCERNCDETAPDAGNKEKPDKKEDEPAPDAGDKENPDKIEDKPVPDAGDTENPDKIEDESAPDASDKEKPDKKKDEPAPDAGDKENPNKIEYKPAPDAGDKEKPDKKKDEPAPDAGDKENPDKIEDNAAPDAGDNEKPGKQKDEPAPDAGDKENSDKSEDKPALDAGNKNKPNKNNSRPAGKKKKPGKKNKPGKKKRPGLNRTGRGTKDNDKKNGKIMQRRSERRNSNNRNLRVNRSSTLATING